MENAFNIFSIETAGLDVNDASTWQNLDLIGMDEAALTGLYKSVRQEFEAAVNAEK